MRYPGFVIFIMNILAHDWNAVLDATVMQKYAILLKFNRLDPLAINNANLY